MSTTNNIAVRPAPRKIQDHAVKPDKPGKKPEVDIQALQKELQTKRKLLNLLEEKGVPHKIDVKAIDKALADLDAIIGSKGNV